MRETASSAQRTSSMAAAWLQRAVTFALVALIRCYQGMIRPLLIGSCKFCPTCSEYAAEALQTHGIVRGSILAVRRLCRCHPLSGGGIDPVPEPSPTLRRGRRG